MEIYIFFLFPLKDFDVCLKLVVHPQFIRSLRCLFCGFYMSVTAATIGLDVPLLSTQTKNQPGHFLLSLHILPTLSLMRVQVASASSSVSRWGLLTNMVGSGRGWAR